MVLEMGYDDNIDVDDDAHDGATLCGLGLSLFLFCLVSCRLVSLKLSAWQVSCFRTVILIDTVAHMFIVND